MPNNNVVIEGKVWAVLFRACMVLMPLVLAVAVPWATWVTASITDLKTSQISPADYQEIQRTLVCIATEMETNRTAILRLPPVWLTNRIEELKTGQMAVCNRVELLNTNVTRLQVQMERSVVQPESGKDHE